MEKTAVFPGSFDPITIGHVDIIHRALPLFDRIVVAIGVNSRKQTLFSLEQRMGFIETIYRQEPKVTVATFEGLTVNYCKQINAQYILRGLRTASDFDYERTIALLNRTLASSIETVFLASRPELSHISSTIVREIYINQGDVSRFVHADIAGELAKQDAG